MNIFKQKHYEMALKFYERIIISYRDEQWFSILTSTLINTLQCCFILKKDFIDFILYI